MGCLVDFFVHFLIGEETDRVHGKEEAAKRENQKGNPGESRRGERENKEAENQ